MEKQRSKMKKCNCLGNYRKSDCFLVALTSQADITFSKVSEM